MEQKEKGQVSGSGTSLAMQDRKPPSVKEHNPGASESREC